MKELTRKEELIEELERKIAELKRLSREAGLDISHQIKALEEEKEKVLREIYENLTPWERVQLARHPKRPTTLDFIEMMTEDFLELKGDRYVSDDPAIVGGIAFLDNTPLMIIGHQKGRDLEERKKRNFGMPHPEGFRKAIRLMKLAERMGLPILSFVDTPGAYPGVGAEERGQFIAIAESIMTMARLKVPTLVVVIGEGGSGGALGIGVGNYILMMEHAYFSVISPEGCASIIYRDANRAPEAANKLRLVATDLVNLGVVDEIVPEPLGGAHRDPRQAASTLKNYVKKYLEKAMELFGERALEHRYRKYRKLGVFLEGESLKSSADLVALYKGELPPHLRELTS